jgi:integration host factor subunit beta
MTKAELVEEVSRVSDLTKKHSEVIVDTVFKSIIDALHRGEKIELRGFGSFRLRKREPRKGRNPKTGDKVDVPPKKVPYFKPGKELKDLINREAEEAEAAAAIAPAVPPSHFQVSWIGCGLRGDSITSRDRKRKRRASSANTQRTRITIPSNLTRWFSRPALTPTSFSTGIPTTTAT